MTEAPDEAAQNFRLVGCLERLAEELERWGADHGITVIVRVRPATRPFPTLVVRAGGPHINVLAGSSFWVERSVQEPSGIYGPEHEWLGRLDAPQSAAAKVGELLTAREVSERGRSDAPRIGRR